MATLAVGAQGEVKFQPDMLQHLGLEPGGEVEVDLLPDGKAALRAVRPERSIESIFGMLEGKTTKIATLEEIDEATRDGWAGLVIRA